MKNNQSPVTRVEIDRELCIGAGTCVTMASSSFALDESAKAIWLGTNDSREDEIIAAAKACPVQAIRLYDKSGQVVYPLPDDLS